MLEVTKAHAVILGHLVALSEARRGTCVSAFQPGSYLNLAHLVSPLSHAVDSEISFYHGDTPNYPYIKTVVGPALRCLRSLARVSIDSQDQLIEWVLPKHPESTHVAHVWMRSQGSLHEHYHKFLQCIESCCSASITTLVLGSDKGQFCEEGQSFRGCTSNIGGFTTKIEKLDIRMPSIALRPITEIMTESNDFLNKVYEILSNCNAITAHEIVMRATRLQELHLVFSHKVPKLLRDRHLHDRFFPHFSLIDSFHLISFPRLRRLSIGSFSATESRLLTFLNNQQPTLRHLTLANAQIYAGSWASCLSSIRETLNLESAAIRESLCEPSTRTSLVIGQSACSDEYSHVIRRTVWRKAEFGKMLGRICTVKTLLDSEVRSSTLVLLKEIFTYGTPIGNVLPPTFTGGLL